jgi:hypothetical protein
MMLMAAVAAAVMPACESLPPELAAREAAIAAEPRGNFFVGRRYFVESTRFWGYLRRPGESWESAKLVVMRETRTRVPDRLPEEPVDASLAHGFDHNHEYRVYGSFSGRPIYDPNSNLFLPEFVPTRFELVNSSPGFLFRPNERHNPTAISIYPKKGVPRL